MTIFLPRFDAAMAEVQMSDKPIIFSGPMVRALFSGAKTQTRRLINPQPDTSKIGTPFHPEPRGNGRWVFMSRDDVPSYSFATADFKVRFAVGDRLYVREHWRTIPGIDDQSPNDMISHLMPIRYEADGFITADTVGWGRFRQGMHMPRWASRLTLHVTDVLVQRLQEISREDAIAEGMIFTDFGEYVPPGIMSVDGGKTFHPFRPRQHDGWHWGEATRPEQCLGSAVSAYANLWNHINGDGSWDANPWCCAISFRCIPKNINNLTGAE